MQGSKPWPPAPPQPLPCLVTLLPFLPVFPQKVAESLPDFISPQPGFLQPPANSGVPLCLRGAPSPCVLLPVARRAALDRPLVGLDNREHGAWHRAGLQAGRGRAQSSRLIRLGELPALWSGSCRLSCWRAARRPAPSLSQLPSVCLRVSTYGGEVSPSGMQDDWSEGPPVI